MKFGLRLRTLALPAGVLAALAVGACILGINRLQSGFRQLEEEELARTRERAVRVMAKHFDAETQKVRDWAEWDDAANWLAGTNPGFAKSNLSDSTLSILGEDRLIYWDMGLKVQGMLPGHAALGNHLERDLRALVSQGNFPWSGLIWSDSALVVATLREVLSSSGEPPRRGWLTMAHNVDAKMLASLSKDLQCQVWITLDASRDTAGSIEIITEDSVVVGLPLRVEGRDVATLRMGLKRPLHQLGRKASFQYFLHFSGASISFVALALLLLERLVLFRLMRLTKGVDRIREQGVAAPLVHDPKRDEIGELSLRIDEMVAAIRASQQQVAEALYEAQTASRARVNFLASMTHELRTPLNGVIGLTEYVLKSERDAESREALELSRGAALGLLETINGVLEFARLEKGDIDLVLDDANLELVVVEPVKVLSSVAVKKGISIQVRIDPRLPQAVRIDPARLRQVLNNLVGNAIKFTEVGQVKVSVTQQPSPSGVKVSFEVVDSGVGIPPDRLHAIFEPFEQATSETAIRFGGTGLGLTIASRLVRAMGGEIQVESQLGEGSRFHFELELPVVDPRPLVAKLATRRKLRIRLLLGDPVLVPMVQDILELMGLTAEVVTPGSGPHSYGSSHLVILDSRALIEFHELSGLPPAANLLVISDPEHVRDIRVHLVSFRSEIAVLPTGPGAIAKAIEQLAIPKARIVVAVSGIMLRGLVVGMIERTGLIALEAASCHEAIARIDSYECQVVVVDLDDSEWEPLVRRCGVVFPMVGLTEDPGDTDVETTVSKPVRVQRLLKAIETALEGAPEGPDSKYWPSSGEV